LQFIAPMQIGVGSDSNFLVNRTDPTAGVPITRPVLLDDKFFQLTFPKLGYLDDSRRHELTATYMPEVEMYLHNKDQNAFNQQATVDFRYFLTRNTQISLGDAYRSTKDPARTLQNVFLLLPRGPYSDNGMHGSFDYQPNKVTSLGVQYDRTTTKYGQDDPGRTLDSRSSGFTFNIARMLSRTQRVRFLYSVFKIEPLNRPETDGGAVDPQGSFKRPIHSATLQYRVGLSRGTIAEASAGVFRLDTGFDYAFRFLLDKRIATYYWLAASYARTLTSLSSTSTAFAQGLGATGFYDTLAFRFNGQPSRKTHVLIETMLARSATNRLFESGKALAGRARFDYRLHDRCVLFFTAESYQQKRNAFVQSPLARNRFMVGLEISLSSEVQQRYNRLNEDGKNVALTDHARRKDKPDQED
jgi:hypothetical protein